MKISRNTSMMVGFAILYGTTGCIGRPPPKMGAAPGTPPPSPALVSSCESTRTWHNVWTIMGTVFGGASGASGTADALTQDKTAQTGISIGIAGAGLIAAVSAAAAGIEADTYSTDNCQAVLSAAASAGDQK